METWTRPRSLSSNPRARTAGRPPSFSRTAFAALFAMETSQAARVTLYAIRAGAAPAGAVGRGLVKVDGGAECVGKPRATGALEPAAVLHRDAGNRDEREHVKG